MKRERGRMLAIKKEVEAGRYQVDARLVADAIIRRIGARRRQNECSNPDSSREASRKTTPGSPCTTDPMKLSWTPLTGEV